MSLTEAIEAQTALLASELPLLRPAVGAGTAFPTGVSAGTRFWRTDLALECYYDGAKWLSTQEYLSDYNVYNLGNSAGGFRKVRENVLLLSLEIKYYIYAPADSTKYYGIACQQRYINLTIPNAWTSTVLVMNLIVAGGFMSFDINKVGAPGALYFASSMIYRRVLE